MLPYDHALGRQLPHGLTDLFFEPAAAKAQMERLLQETFQRWGYSRIILPTFEYYATLATGASPQLQEEMYRFFDRDGQILALRPDMTVPTARVVATRLYDQPLPLRFFYVGSVFRYEEPQAGRRREFTQAGIELIGADTAEADAEVLSVAIAALACYGYVRLSDQPGPGGLSQGHPGRGPSGQRGRAPLEQAIGRRNDVELQEALDELGIAGDAARAIRAVPHLCGDEGVLGEAERLSTNSLARQAIARLARVYALLRLEGLAEHVILDLGEVRSMDYYTGITFHGYVAGLGFPICGGGRYDRPDGQFRGRPARRGLCPGRGARHAGHAAQVDIAPDLVMGACAHLACRTLASRARAVGSGGGGRPRAQAARRCSPMRAPEGRTIVVSCRDASSYVLADATDLAPRSAGRELEEEIASWNR